MALVLFLFLGNVRGAFIVALTIPFSLLFASVCLDLRHIPANLLSLGALDFGMVVDGAVVMIENIVRHLNRRESGTIGERIRAAAHEVQRPVFYAIAIIITAYLPIFTLQRVEGPPVQADGLDRGVRAAGRAAVFDAYCAGAGQRAVSAKARASGATRSWGFSRRSTARRCSGPFASAGSPWAAARSALAWRPIWHSAESSARSFCRTWMRAPSGSAALWRQARARRRASGWRSRPSSCWRHSPR